MDDTVRALGHLALGTRLKRLGDRLQAETHAILLEASVALPASHLPPLAALQRGGAMTVGDLARALGVAQPGVTRMTGVLEAAGLVRSEQAEADRRVRVLTLTTAGQKLLTRLQQRTFPLIEAAVREACADASGSFLAQLSALEDALEDASLAERAHRLSKGAL